MKLKKIQNILLIINAICATVYVYLYSIYLSFDIPVMILIYIIMMLITLCLNEEHVLYTMMLCLPMRKLIYIGSFNFFNIILIALFIKKLNFKRMKISKIPFMVAFITILYDIMISLISLPQYSVSAYMVKWYFGFLVFLLLLNKAPERFDSKQAALFLNIGLFVVGILTIKQYAEYSGSYAVITGGLREYLGGALGSLDQNTFSFHCLIGAVSAIAIYINSSKKDNKVFLIVLLALGLFSLICGMYMVSKGFYVALAIIGIIVAIKMNSKIIKYWKQLLVIGVAIIVFIRTDRVQMLINSIFTRFNGASDINQLTTGRSELYMYYINAIFSSPIKLLFGAGLNTYRLVFNAHNNYITHNTTLELLAAWGLPMSILIVGSIFTLTRKQLKNNKNVNLVILLPMISLLIFSQTVSMFWEDASLFYFVFSVYFAINAN